MESGTNFGQIRNIPFLGLLVNIFIAIALLVVINFYSLKTMSAMRAYIHGESSYSKAEKEATQYLINYLHTQDTAMWARFLEAIKVPVGDTIARRGLMDGDPVEKVRNGFLQGGNHPEDIGQMIWLFKRFKHVELMRRPIKIWQSSDSLIYQKILIARQINHAINTDSISFYRSPLLARLQANAMALNEREQAFSAHLGRAARTMAQYLFYVNLFITLGIMAGIYFYVFKVLARLKENNLKLAQANKELDRLVYSISHDLRAPINSMKGLVGLAKREGNTDAIKPYFTMMEKSLLQQEAFVRKTIELAKESRTEVIKEIVDMDQVIEEIVNLHRHMPEAEGISFKTAIGVKKVFSDKHHLEVILRNLVSNAIKYHDPGKSDKFIKIETSSKLDEVRIEVSDNGVGIDSDYQSRVFDMFFMSAKHEKGTGLGLYIVNEMVSKLGGKVLIRSKLGEGSTFSVLLKK